MLCHLELVTKRVSKIIRLASLRLAFHAAAAMRKLRGVSYGVKPRKLRPKIPKSGISQNLGFVGRVCPLLTAGDRSKFLGSPFGLSLGCYVRVV